MNPPVLYAIADAEILSGSLSTAVGIMAQEGLRWIQVRAKRLSDRALYEMLAECCELLAGGQACLWVNDRPDVAALLPVFGVHLGQADVAPALARRVLGTTLAIGLSTHSRSQAAAAQRETAVDVVALGPIFATSSKERPDPTVGVEGLRTIRHEVKKPLIAIGGIDASNARAVLDAGADCLAVLGAVCRGDVAANCRQLLAAVA
jgi:thiamine-phosphate pyrophosphorylase